MSEKIYRLGGVSSAWSGEGVQLNLFNNNLYVSAPVSYVDINALDQESLFHIIARNAVANIVDLRPVSVFRAPRFDHKQTVIYFYAREVSYIEWSVLTEACDAEARSCAAQSSAKIKKGFTVCIYDDDARQLGWVDSFKAHARAHKMFDAEVNPRSLTFIGFEAHHVVAG